MPIVTLAIMNSLICVNQDIFRVPVFLRTINQEEKLQSLLRRPLEKHHA